MWRDLESNPNPSCYVLVGFINDSLGYLVNKYEFEDDTRQSSLFLIEMDFFKTEES
jgi:hypothetical protein